MTEHTQSYYAASANPAPPRPPLEGEHQADVAVLGGGFSGLSAALHLAEAGYHVKLVEAAKVGWGASGRNGGQIVNGLNASLEKIERTFGQDAQRFVGHLVQEGGKIIRDRIARYDIQCDLREGNLFAAYTDAQMRELVAKKTLWARFGMTDHQMLSREEIREHVASDVYAGGMIDHTGGHLHPLNLALGQAAALESLGGVIFEQSLVTSVDHAAARPSLTTSTGQITADALVICGNAYLGDALPELSARVLPCSTQVMATEPLVDPQAILPTDLCVEDVRYILDYYRLSA
ncbi:MAG: FAD-binding oxidoreductase, partial [Pseudomonadota bacterium]